MSTRAVEGDHCARSNRRPWATLSLFTGQITGQFAGLLAALTIGSSAGLACHASTPVHPPTDTQTRVPRGPTTSVDDEALLAMLLAEDPGDFNAQRARLWRFGPLRWVADGPSMADGPNHRAMAGRDLPRALNLVVIDVEGPRVLLPLAALALSLSEDSGDGPGSDPRSAWSGLVLVAVPQTSDLVVGLRRELSPTPWLTVAAGVPLSPLPLSRPGSEGGPGPNPNPDPDSSELRVRWSDPACGFGLELAIDRADFGPLYEPGPAGGPDDPPRSVALAGEPGLRLAPGSSIYGSTNAPEPVIRLRDAASTSQGERLNAAQRVRSLGPKTRGRQAIELRCRGVVVRGWVENRALIESSASYSLARARTPESSSCARRSPASRAPVTIPRATPLFEPGDGGILIGVTTDDIDVSAALADTSGEGWWEACVPSPWGDLVFRFQQRLM